jgi:dTDP-4-dehydrorhamnose 3,5-epimerase
MTEIVPSGKIAGVKFSRLTAHTDARGRFLETFRKDWFPERSWEVFQTNRSDSKAGVLRGLHYHFKQIDYWYAANGRIRDRLADLRRSSPTFGASEVVEIGEENQVGIFIPCGVAHGFYALTDATLTYIVDNYYDGADEFGVAWDDPDLAIAWNAASPVLSPRDAKNLRLSEIPETVMPK